jgi:hypothetical protein
MARAFILAACWAALLSGCSTRQAYRQTAASPPEPYVRISTADSNRLDFQIVLREFAPTRKAGPEVWLSGVSHIGDRDYYAQLQKHLDERTVVLFEGVGEDRDSASAPVREAPSEPEPASSRASDKPHGTGPGGESNSLQSQIASSLGLVFQLDSIDYERPNFRHCDLSVSQIRDLMAEQEKSSGTEGSSGAVASFDNLVQLMEGGSFMDLLIRMGLKFMGANAYLQGLGKLALMESLEDVQGDPSQMTGLPASMNQLLTVIIQKRNEHVLHDLEGQLKHMDPGGSISIFYGTGHMPDLEAQLRKKLHYRPVGQVWLTVFSVDLAKAGISRSEAQFLKSMVKQGMGPPTTAAGTKTK